VVEFPVESLGGRAVTFGADGRLRHIMTDARRVVALGPDGAASLVAEDLAARDLVSLYQGDSYALESGTGGTPARLWLLRPDGSKRVVDDAAPVAGGLALSPDQTLLYASEEQSHWVVSYQIQPDGVPGAPPALLRGCTSRIRRKQAGARGMACDAEGRLYVATHLGIQICDQAGRVNAILPVPGGRAWAVALGGERLDQLFVSTGDRVYRRALNTRGVHAWAPPVKPAAPRL
jgi:gluconolactonase